MCGEIIESYNEETKTTSTNFNKKKPSFKTQNFYITLYIILILFFLIPIALLIAVNIYYYLTKYWGKEKYLLPLHFTNNKLKEIIY